MNLLTLFLAYVGLLATLGTLTAAVIAVKGVRQGSYVHSQKV